MVKAVKKNKIVEDDLVNGARIDGSRVRVSDVAVDIDYHDLKPEEIAEEYSLDVSQVYSAISYYRENSEKIRKEIRQREQKIES